VHPVEVVETHFGDRCQQHDPGGVDDDVDAAEARRDLVEQAAHLLLIRDVAIRRHRHAAGRLDGAGDLLGSIGATDVMDGNVHPARRKLLGYRSTDSAGAAQHDCGARCRGCRGH
jgi:hypothetical protein